MPVSGKVAGSVGGVGVAGAITTIAVFVAKTRWNVDIPDNVGEAITTLLACIGAGLGGYVMPHRQIVAVPPAIPPP